MRPLRPIRQNYRNWQNGRFCLKYATVRATTKILDEKAFIVEAVMSTEARDRQGDIIRARGWELSEFRKHPVLLVDHDYSDIRSQIGRWDDVKIVGDTLVGVARYYVGEGNDKADWGWKLAMKGVAAYSVAFIPDMDKAKELDGDGWFPNYEFDGQTLLETSHVTVPANPEALQLAKGLDYARLAQEIIKARNPEVPKSLREVIGSKVIERLGQ